MIRIGLSILFPPLALVINGCDDDAGQRSASVTMTGIESEHATCGTLSHSALELTIRNDGAAPVAPERVSVTTSVGRMVSAFAAGSTVPPGATVTFECHGEHVGTLADDAIPSEVVLRYAVDGEAMTARANGTHQSWRLFDFCDTAFPEVATPDCVVVSPSRD